MKKILSLLALVLATTFPASAVKAGDDLCMDTEGLPPLCVEFLNMQCVFYTLDIQHCMTLEFPVNINCIINAAQNYQDNVNSILQLSICQPGPEPHPGQRTDTAPPAMMFAKAANFHDPAMFRGIDLWKN